MNQKGVDPLLYFFRTQAANIVQDSLFWEMLVAERARTRLALIKIRGREVSSSIKSPH